MKLSVIFVLLLVNRIKPERTNDKLLLKLPAIIGEYRTDFKKMYNCNTMSQNKITLNYYLNKMTDNSMEIKGNLSNVIPIDDNLSTSNYLFKIIIYIVIAFTKIFSKIGDEKSYHFLSLLVKLCRYSI
ncbi:hypothetical protein ACI65C_010619 [Semiaphis heraclei]